MICLYTSKVKPRVKLCMWPTNIEWSYDYLNDARGCEYYWNHYYDHLSSFEHGQVCKHFDIISVTLTLQLSLYYTFVWCLYCTNFVFTITIQMNFVINLACWVLSGVPHMSLYPLVIFSGRIKMCPGTWLYQLLKKRTYIYVYPSKHTYIIYPSKPTYIHI